MHPILRRCAIIAVLLIPSLYSLLRNPDVPKFCQWHDDCVYVVSAKSLTDGGGYRIMSLPGEPAQTKYPPLYPLLLSLGWMLQPNFPETLTYAAWITWMPLPFSLWLLASYLPRFGLEGWRMWTLLAIVALSPYTLLFSTTLLSEPLFAALLLASLLLAERAADNDPRNPAGLALLSGIVMGFAYLARSSGIVAIAALPAFFWWRRQPCLAFPFLLGMLPFVISWTAWARIHQTHTSDPMLMYYVDYASYEVYNIPFKSIPLVLWKNIDGLIGAFGSMILIKFSDSPFLKMVQLTLGVAVIAGLIRLAKNGRCLSFLFFALGNAFLLLIWHFPPDQRFIYPLLPLVMAAFWTEMEHRIKLFLAGLHNPDWGQRIAARGLLAALGLTLSVSLALQAYFTLYHLPRDGNDVRTTRIAQTSAYEWIAKNTDPSAAFISTVDPFFYLQTGRHAIRLTVPPILWYRNDHDSIKDLFRDLVPYAREHKLDYVYHAGLDFIWGVDDEDRLNIDKTIRSNRDLVTMFQKDASIIYKVRPQTLIGTANRAFQKSVDHSPDQNNP